MSVTKKFTILLFSAFVGLAASAHNQNPATTRKSMDKAFQALEAPLPGNVFKGKANVRAAGTTLQVFDAVKDGKLVGKVAQFEFQEIPHVVAVDETGAVKAVIRDGSSLPPSDWATLPFVQQVANALVPGKQK